MCQQILNQYCIPCAVYASYRRRISDQGLMGLRLVTVGSHVAEKLQDLPKLRAGKFDRKLAAIWGRPWALDSRK